MTTTIDGVFVELTGSLARSGISAASFAELSDDESENTHRAIARHMREVATYYALSAANVASRSDWQLGREGLARRKGYPSAEVSRPARQPRPGTRLWRRHEGRHAPPHRGRNHGDRSRNRPGTPEAGRGSHC